MNQGELLIYYWQLPKDIFISLSDNFHKEFCSTIKEKSIHKYKNCFYKILNCSKNHAYELFIKRIRFRVKELEILRRFSDFSKEEVERNIETIGNYEDGTIIKNPKFPFYLKDIFYIASHLSFDGSFRFKKGCYFYAFEPSLVEYHEKRLKEFGDVPTNFIKKENQLYFSYTLGYITAKILEIETFKSKDISLSNKFKLLAKKHKILCDEVVKALIIDEGSIGDKIEAELANQKLIEDLYEVIKIHYNLTKIGTRTRYVYFKENSSWNHTLNAWKLGFSASSFKDLYNSISPLPINYKEENLKFLYELQTRNWFRKKDREIKKLILLSLIKKPKTIFKLAKELCIRQTTVAAHIKKLPMVIKVNEVVLRRGGYSKANVFGVKDTNKAKNYIKS